MMATRTECEQHSLYPKVGDGTLAMSPEPKDEAVNSKC